VYREGVRIERLTRPLSRTDTTTPAGDHGLAVEYFNGYDVAAPAVRAAVHGSGLIRFFGTLPEEIDPAAFGARVRGTFTADVDGPHDFGIVSTGGARFSVAVGGDEHVVLDDPERTLPRSEEFFGYGHDEATVTVELQAGQTVEVAADWTNHGTRGFAALRLGVRRPEPADLLDQAVAAAADADAAIVMVGTNDEWETEGFDRATMDLPGRQDELVERVAAANPNTVVIVNAGSPVTLDWAADDHHHPVPAVLTSFFAGQEQAEALVDVVLGVAQPSGRLPVTYPRRLHDTPAFLDHRPDHATADGGVQFYSEGPFVGHRWYDARQIAPRFWFGHGLGYAAARWHEPTASHTTLDADALLAGDTTLEVTVELDGPPGTWPAVEVVQGYVHPVAPRIRRPHKWLAAFTKVQVPAGSTAGGRLRFGADAFRHWDVPGAQWSIDPGDYEIVVARSADPADECGRVRVSVVR
jgi:beta-glucosidase